MKISLPVKLLLGLCALHLLVNVTWLILNQSPVPWDQAGNTRLAIEFSQYWTGSLTKNINPLSISSYYPPLTHVVTSLLLTVLGFNVDVAAFVITLYFVAMLIGLFLMVRSLTKDEWVALLTAAFFSFYLPVYENARWFLLDIPLMTLLMYAWYFLFKSQGFRSWKYSFLFTLCTIGVLLTKWVGVVFLVVPGLFIFIQELRKGITRQQLTHFYISLVFVMVGIFPWYITNVHRLVEIGRLASRGEITDPQTVLSSQNLLFYFTHILNFQLTLLPAVTAFIAAGAYLLHKKTPYKILLATYFVSGYAFFTFISNKDIRYTIPLLVVFALTSAYMLVTWARSKQWLGVGVIGVSLPWLAVQFFILSFHLLPVYQRAVNLGVLGWIDYINTGDIVITPPRPNTSPNQQLITFLRERQKQQPVSIMVGIDQAQTNPSNLDLEILMQQASTLSLEAPYNITGFTSHQQMVGYLERFHYYLIPTDEVGPDASRHKGALQQIQKYITKDEPDLFEEVASYKTNTPAGDLRVYKKKS